MTPQQRMGPSPDSLVPRAVRARLATWARLTRKERMLLARELRGHGLSLGEIATLIPVSKSTLSVWCRPVTLTADQGAAIRLRTKPAKGVPRDTQRKRRIEVARIESRARMEAAALLTDPRFTAGAALYCAEGSKTERRLEMANADPRVLTLFIDWVRRFHDRKARFVGALNIHADNDVDNAHRFWGSHLPVRNLRFTKAYVKPDGTGHRRNYLPFGVCRIRVSRSTDAFIRTMAWIDALALEWGLGVATLPPGR